MPATLVVQINARLPRATREYFGDLAADISALAAAEAERRRLIDLAFQEQARRAWPELAQVATCIDEANAVWREYLVWFANRPVAGLPWLQGCIDFELDNPLPDELAPAPRPQTHRRAGITKNKMRGQTKMRRRMAAQSRRRNRSRAG